MEWTKEILAEFIDMYRQRPCLWKIREKCYLNKNLKMQAYEDLLNFLKSKNCNNVTIKDIKTKIQNIRNAFRKEVKKIDESRRSGAGSENVYTPTLWYYNLLLFTKDQDLPLESVDNVSTADYLENETVEVSNEDTSFTELSQDSLTEPANGGSNETHAEISEVMAKPQPSKGAKRKKSDRDPEVLDFIKACTKTLSTPESQDEFDNVCRSFASKLRKMEPRQQIYAESLMHTIVTKGLLGELNEYVVIIDNSPDVTSPVTSPVSNRSVFSNYSEFLMEENL